MRTRRFADNRAAAPPFELAQIIHNGQSLSTGTGSTDSGTPVQPYSNVMVTDSLGTTSGYVTSSPQAATLSLVPLVTPERTISSTTSTFPYARNLSGSTAAVSMANELTALMMAAGFRRFALLSSVTGIGGAGLSVIQKGGSGNSYAAGIYETQVAAPGAGNGNRAALSGYPTFGALVNVLTHGETDGTNYAALNTTDPSAYATFLAGLQSNYETDQRAAGALSVSWLPHVPLVLSQLNSAPGPFAGRCIVGAAMLSAAQTSPELFISACPKYMLPPNGVFHLTDYRTLGELYALFASKYLLEHWYAYRDGRATNPAAWAPLWATGVSRSGTSVTITLNVPSGPLVWDTTTFAAVHTSGSWSMWSAGKGFEAWDGEVTITNATNASPIVVTTATPHGRTTGDTFAVEGVLGNTAANAVWTATVVDSTHLSLNGSSGNGAYTQGGIGMCPIGITAASLSGNTVQLTLARTPGAAAFVAYGEHVDQAYNTVGCLPMRGGNLRDSSTFVGRLNVSPLAMYANWMHCFVRSLP